MIVIPNITPPGVFTELDSTVTAADRFVDVRTLQTLVDNHNILLARRIRGDCLSMAFFDTTGGSGVTVAHLTAYRHPTAPPLWLDAPILVSQHTQTIRVAVYCAQSRAGWGGDDPELAFSVNQDGLPQRGSILTEDQLYTATVSAASGSPAWYTCDIPLPEHDGMRDRVTFGGHDIIRLRGYVKGTINTSATIATGLTVVEAGENWARVTTGSTFSGPTAIIIDGRAIEPAINTCVRPTTIGGDKKFFIEPAFAGTVDDTDTITWRQVCGVDLLALTVTELSVTDFGEARRVI